MKLKNIFTLFTALVLITSCNEDKQYLKALDGTWISAENYAFDDGTAGSLLYEFNGDGTFRTLTRVIKDGNVNDVIGFTYWAEGVFTLDESKLSLSYEEIYLSDNFQNFPLDIDDLILTSDKYIQEVTISFSNQNSVLTFIYPACGPNESCVGNQSFNRLAFIE
uniref:hypothetical protein n=1 Tax=Roseivirga sp. TaxID=1964215 RepID=UPI00404784FA